MSYLVFARKYRPRTFAEILGQGPIVTTLKNAIRQRRIGQGYLFAGPRGTGKTSTARIFAKSLNCEEGPTITPCLKCQRCQEIAEGRSLDILEIDGASNRGIDQIRTLREHSKFAPTAGAYKIYIIDEVHQITAEGFNALLKILEEPPPHVLFILATTAPHKVPATILSRCQRYDFKRLPADTIIEKLNAIAQDEKLEVTPKAVLGIARTASGSLRDAESLLDQLAAFTEGHIREEDVQVLLGTIDEDVFVRVMSAIKEHDSVCLVELVAEAVNAGTDLVQWTVSFLSFLRNLFVAKVGAGPLGFEDLGQESIQRLTALSHEFSVEQLIVIIQAVTAIVETMRRVGEPRIPLEMALIRLSLGDSLVSVAELVDRLETLASGSASIETVLKPVSPPAASKAGPASIQLEAIWPQFLKQIQKQKASVSAYLSEAFPVSLAGNGPIVVTIGLRKGFEFHKNALERPPVRQLIEETFTSLVGSPVRCEFEIQGDAAATPPPGPVEKSSGPEGGSPAQDPSFLNSVADLFQGRVIGEGG